jgi:hypothetical protein
MRTAARRSRTTATLGLLVAAVCALASAAGAAPRANVDLQIDIVVGSSVRTARSVPNGGTATVAGLNLAAGVEIGLITALPASAKVRLTLPDGLTWGTDLPDPGEGCTSTASTGECQTPVLEPIAGRNAVGWGWDVVAARTGSYVLRAEIVSASDPDPEPSNDTASVTVVVTEASSPPPPGGGGGVRVGAAKVSPAKPKAGSTVVATVRMTDGANPTRPSGVTCTATAGAAKVRGVGRAGNGAATCTYRTPKSGKGKLLRGSVSFTAAGAKYTKRFSVKLR